MDLSNPKNIKKNYDLVVIGASWGGLEALTTVLSSLPKNYPLPILVVQHRQRNQIDTEMLVNVMNKRCKLNVLEPDDKEPIEAGNLYIAPSDYHMFVEHKGEIALSSDELVNYSRPSIDLLFESAADCYQSGVLGIILTGANSDGASGLQTIKN
ncbi:MAG: chemotaxis protein CheB, partial [Pseudomonadales bacterium]|nr:chemotaxis protein CheB [Pseudomonadales bacterium]